MKKLITLVMSVLILSSYAFASGQVEVTGAWVREAPPGMNMMGGYATVTNTSDKDLILTGVSSPQFGSVEMHRTEMKDDKAMMVRQESITIKPGEPFVFAPRGYHFMLMEPNDQLKEGDTVDFTFSFERGESFTFTAPVMKDNGAGMHHMGHGD